MYVIFCTHAYGGQSKGSREQREDRGMPLPRNIPFGGEAKTPSWPLAFPRQRVGTMPTLPIFVHRARSEMAKDTQLRGLAEAALKFCEARELSQREHGVPQRDGFLVPGNAGNHRAKKRYPIGG